MNKTTHDQIALSVIDNWLRYRIDHSDLPGMQICIRKAGDILLSAAYGKANISTGEEFTPAHLCQFASHSKMVTSCAIHILIKEEKLKLNQPIVEILSDFKAHRDSRFAQITIRDLLSNRSGLIRDGLNGNHWNFLQPFPDYSQIIHDARASDLVYDPNTNTKYSNLGFSLLGLIIEIVSGMNYDRFVKERIFSKFPDEIIFSDFVEDKKHLFALGYSMRKSSGERLAFKHKYTHGMAAAAGLCTTTKTMSLFLHRLLFTDTFLPKSFQHELWNLSWPVMNGKDQHYGLGIQTDKLNDFTFVGHSGGTLGFMSNTRNWAGTDYILSLIFNSDQPSLPILKAAVEIIDIIQKNLSDDDLKTVNISKPMTNRWETIIYVVCERKALSFNISSWAPCSDQPIAERHDSGSYFAQKNNGYGNPGEPINFLRAENGEIILVQDGSWTLHPENEYSQLSADMWAE